MVRKLHSSIALLILPNVLWITPNKLKCERQWKGKALPIIEACTLAWWSKFNKEYIVKGVTDNIRILIVVTTQCTKQAHKASLNITLVPYKVLVLVTSNGLSPSRDMLQKKI